jgi:hypothetical protein
MRDPARSSYESRYRVAFLVLFLAVADLMIAGGAAPSAPCAPAGSAKTRSQSDPGRPFSQRRPSSRCTLGLAPVSLAIDHLDDPAPGRPFRVLLSATAERDTADLELEIVVPARASHHAGPTRWRGGLRRGASRNLVATVSVPDGGVHTFTAIAQARSGNATLVRQAQAMVGTRPRAIAAPAAGAAGPPAMIDPRTGVRYMLLPARAGGP